MRKRLVPVTIEGSENAVVDAIMRIPERKCPQ
jgi:hypothetical protein